MSVLVVAAIKAASVDQYEALSKAIGFATTASRRPA